VYPPRQRSSQNAKMPLEKQNHFINLESS
jgi:hypothetical protein